MVRFKYNPKCELTKERTEPACDRDVINHGRHAAASDAHFVSDELQSRQPVGQWHTCHAPNTSQTLIEIFQDSNLLKLGRYWCGNTDLKVDFEGGDVILELKACRGEYLIGRRFQYGSASLSV